MSSMPLINLLQTNKDTKVNFSRDTLKSYYRYYVNDRNEYNNLMALIENLEGLAHKQEIILY